MKRVIVGSHNPVKIAAVEEAFAQVFPEDVCEFISCAVPSGVPDQPFGSEETKTGAYNRAKECKGLHEGADYFVGLEGGLEKEGDELWASAWMCVLDRDGGCGFGKTSAFLLPPAVARAVEHGKELGDATDEVFSTLNSKHAGGTVGILTSGLITRKDFYRDAIIFALIPFIQSSLYR